MLDCDCCIIRLTVKLDKILIFDGFRGNALNNIFLKEIKINRPGYEVILTGDSEDKDAVSYAFYSQIREYINKENCLNKQTSISTA